MTATTPVRKCSTDGRVLLTIGIPHKHGAVHERRAVPPVATHTALSPKGEIYVSDVTAMPVSTSSRRTAGC